MWALMPGTADKHRLHKRRGRRDAFPAIAAACAAARDGGQAAPRAGPGSPRLLRGEPAEKRRRKKVYLAHIGHLLRGQRVGSPEEEVKKKRI